MGKSYYVRATVGAYINAESEGEAMQELCTRLGSPDPRGAPQDYEVTRVDVIMCKEDD